MEVIISAAEWNLIFLRVYVMSPPMCWGEVAADIGCGVSCTAGLAVAC